MPHGVDVALLVVGDVAGRGGLGIGQRRLLGDGAGDALAHLIGVEIEPRLDIRRELIADIAADAGAAAEAVVPETVGRLRRGGDETVPRTVGAAGVGLQPLESECADIGRHAVRQRIAAGRHHEIDGAAERVGAELQRVGALADLDIFVGGRIDLLEIAVAVRRVDRDAVHIELHAAQMEIARQAGAADRKPGVVAPFRLREHARHVIQDVLDGVGDGRVPVGRGRHERDAARASC